MRRSLRVFVPALLVFAFAAPALAQRKADPEKTIARYKAYLARKPYHEWAFEKLVEAAVSVNKLDDLVEAFAERLEEQPEDEATAVVLVRLRARTDAVDEALEGAQALLKQVPEKRSANLRMLIGRLHLRRSEPAKALEVLDGAVAYTRDKKLLGALHRTRGEAALAAGEKPRAVRAFRDMAALDPKNLNTRLEVAGVFRQHGLAEEALAEFAVAEELAGRSTSKRCRVLSEKGRLHEQLLQIEEALGVYRQAIGLMARGNWLKKDLYERVLALHQRSGKLPALLETCRADVDGNTQDLDAREFLARVHVAAGERKQAREILAKAVKDFPEDRALSQTLIALLEELEDPEGVIAEYQRILVHHPGELDLYLELGKVFASAGRFEQAKLQWERTLEKRLQDASLCIRLADLYAFYDQPEEAIRLYRKAISLEPKQIGPYGDLARYLRSKERGGEAEALLNEAAARAAGDASSLEQLSALWQEHEQPARALKALEAALALKPEDPRLLGNMAELQLDQKQFDQALETLRQVINRAGETSVRGAAVDKILRVARQQETVQAVAEAQAKLVAADSAEAAPYLILARMHQRAREPQKAITVLKGLLKHHPEHEDAHRILGKVHEGLGEYQTALSHYQVLVRRSPQMRRKYLKEIASIHLSLYQQDEAFACYDEILRGAASNAAAFKEVADAYGKLGLNAKARECMLQAVRLKPEDGRYHLELADLHQALGDADKALAEVEAAVRSKDEDVREDARARHYQLLAEQGGLEGAIEKLRERVDTNPYDVESPLTLVDFYVRELEYELALEMLKKLLTYQPKQPRLLRERARLRFLMEDYDASIADYETLWKLPKSKKASLAVKIARAAIKGGKLERAQTALESVGDAREVANLYREFDLIKEAVSALETGVQQAPGDVRLHMRLADLRGSMGDREGAIESLEKVLSLQGDRWKTIVKLGDLYHQVERKEDALRCGKRLFDLIRIEHKEPADPKAKHASGSQALRITNYAKSYRYSSSSRRNTLFARRIRQVLTYFQQKGLHDEFTEQAAAELKLQPTNLALLNTLQGHLNRKGDKEDRVRELLVSVREATVPAGKHPPEFTLRGWTDYLDTAIVGRSKRDPKRTKQRLEELEAAMQKASSEVHWIEKVQLLDGLRKSADARAAAREGLKAYPESARLNLSLGLRHVANKEWEEALPFLRKAIATLDAEHDPKQEQLEAELTFKKQRSSLLRGFPSWLQGRVGDESLRRLYHLTQRVRRSAISWGVGQRPQADAVRDRLVTCLSKLDRKDEAKQVLATLEPKRADDLYAWASLCQAYMNEELYDEVEAIARKLQVLERELDRDPVLGHNRRWAAAFSGPMKNLAEVLEKRGEVFEAYDLYRTYGSGSKGELLLTTHDAWGAVSGEYRKRMQAAQTKLEAGDESAQAAYRDAGIKLAELLQFQKRYDEVLALYTAMIERLPDAFSLRKVVGQLHERAGRWEDAVAVHYATIERKRELNRKPGRDRSPKGRVVVPTSPGSGTGKNEDWVWRNLRSGGYSSRNARRYRLNENYAGILKIYLNRKETSKAAEVMRRLAREDVTTFRWMGYTIGQLIQNYRLGAKGVPILRLIYSYNQQDHWLGLQFGRSLIAAKKYDEALKVLQGITGKSNAHSYYVREAQTEIDRVRAKLGDAGPTGIDELRAAVEAEPKNVAKRQRLANQLYEERRFEEALAEARVLRERAPHLAAVKQLLRKCYLVLDQEQEVEALMREELANARREEQRFTLNLELANMKFDPAQGVTPEVEACLKEASKHTMGQFSLANWYMEHDLFAEAQAEIEKILEDRPADYYADQLKWRLARLQLFGGNPLQALDQQWEKLEEAPSREAKTKAFRKLAGVLRVAPRPERFGEAVLAAAKGHGGLRGDLYAAAYHLAVRDLDAAEVSIMAALDRDPDDARFLRRLRVDFARSRGDLEGALKLLEAHAAKELDGNAERKERVAFLNEKAGLLLALERVDEALDLYEEIHDKETPSGQRSLARLYAQHDRPLRAIELWETYLKKRGERSSSDLQQLATLYQGQERHAEAIALFERAKILARRGSREKLRLRQVIIDAHRKAGSMEVARKALKAELEADPDDVDTLSLLTQLAVEEEDEAAVLGYLQRMAERPDGAKTALIQLARYHQTQGHTVEAAATLETLLAEHTTDSWQRRELCRQLARLYKDAGDPDKALDTMRKGFEDPEGVQALRAVARFLRVDLKRPAEAIPMLQELLRLSPRQWSLHQDLAAAHRELKQHREELDHLFVYLASPQGMTRARDHRARILVAADALGEDARLEAALAEKPKDVDLLFRAATLDALRGRSARAIERFQTVIAAEPRHLSARYGVWEAHRDQEAWVAAAKAIEGLSRLLESEAKANNGGRHRSHLTVLRKLRGEMLLRAGDAEGAKRVWRQPLQNTRGRLRAHRYAHYNEPPLDIAAYVKLLAAHRLDADWLTELERAAMLSSNVNVDEYAEALRRAGEGERAEQIAWWNVLDPTAGLVTWSGRGLSFNNRGRPTLVQLTAERGAVDELIERLRELRVKHPTNNSLRRLLVQALGSEQRHADLLALERSKDLPKKKARDPSWHIRVADLLVKLERYEEALPHREKAVALKRFANLRQQQQRSYSSYDARVDTTELVAQRKLMALYAKLGRDAEAAKLEAKLIGEEPKAGDVLAVAGSYAELELVEPARRLCERALKLDPKAAGKAWKLLVHLYRETGDEAQHAAAREAWLADAAKRLAEDPLAKYTSSHHSARAWFLLQEGGDLELALADAQRCVEALPRDATSRRLLGWVHLYRGDAPSAVEHLRAAMRLAALSGERESSDMLYALGLAEAAADSERKAPERYVRTLRRALVLAPLSDDADDAREVLESLAAKAPDETER